MKSICRRLNRFDKLGDKYPDAFDAISIWSIASLSMFAARDKRTVAITSKALQSIVSNPNLSRVIIESPNLSATDGETLQSLNPSIAIIAPGFTKVFGKKFIDV